MQNCPSTRFEDKARVGLAAKKWSHGPFTAKKEEIIMELKRQISGYSIY